MEKCHRSRLVDCYSMWFYVYHQAMPVIVSMKYFPRYFCVEINFWFLTEDNKEFFQWWWAWFCVCDFMFVPFVHTLACKCDNGTLCVWTLKHVNSRLRHGVLCIWVWSSAAKHWNSPFWEGQTQQRKIDHLHVVYVCLTFSLKFLQSYLITSER